MQPRSAEEIRRLAIRWIEEGWQLGREAVVDELHAPEFVDRDAAGRPPDREGFKRGIRDLHLAFPDFEARIEDVLVDASRSEAAVRWTATGTHRGAYLGVAPTGRRIAFKGIEIVRFDGGWIVERWGEWDGIDLLAQLGAR